MSELYVCKQYDTPYERVCAIISPLEEHDKQIRADAIDECIADIKKYARPEDSTTIIGIIYGLEQLKEQSK